MAGIEKVCEYSGDYVGGKMYKYKHNHIQVIPKYRPAFWHKKATLFICNGEIEHKNHEERGYVEYYYCLYVPKAKGNVDGCYWNYCSNYKHVLFNLWELLGNKEIEVMFMDMSIREFSEYKEQYSQNSQIKAFERLLEYVPTIFYSYE